MSLRQYFYLQLNRFLFHNFISLLLPFLRLFVSWLNTCRLLSLKKNIALMTLYSLIRNILLSWIFKDLLKCWGFSSVFFPFYLADVETKMREVTVIRRLVSTVAIFYILGYAMILLLARPKENLMCQTYHQGSGENCHSLNEYTTCTWKWILTF